VTEKKDGLKITNTDAVADELIAALSGTTPLEAAFESEKVTAEVEKVDAPKDEDEDGEDDSSDTPANPTGEQWIDVDLSAKTVTAYVGDTPVWGPRTMVDGKAGNETVTGTYEIYLRYDRQDMTNAGYYEEDDPEYYYTPDVPWVQYFHRGYAFHGAPWRSSFGYSGSHGCINLPVSDAKWLYDWASIGTRTVVPTCGPGARGRLVTAPQPGLQGPSRAGGALQSVRLRAPARPARQRGGAVQQRASTGTTSTGRQPAPSRSRIAISRPAASSAATGPSASSQSPAASERSRWPVPSAAACAASTSSTGSTVAATAPRPCSGRSTSSPSPRAGTRRASCTEKGPTAVRRSAVRWPPTPSAAPRSRASART